jgi:hypothetical protein
VSHLPALRERWIENAVLKFGRIDSERNHNVGAVDIAMVVLFSGLATAVLWPTRREKLPGEAATS